MSDSSYSILPPARVDKISPYNIAWQIACRSNEETWSKYFGVQPWQNIYPNCCGNHKAQAPDISSEEAERIKTKIHDNLSYAIHHLHQNTNEVNYIESNLDYIDFLITSFGKTERGMNIFIHNLKKLISEVEDINEKHRVKLVDYIQWNYLRTNDIKITEKLNDIQFTWYNLFPFDLPQFKSLKSKYSDSVVDIYHSPKDNPFSSISSKRVKVPEKLIEDLTKETNKLLTNNFTIQMELTEYQNLVNTILQENKLRLHQLTDPEQFAFTGIIKDKLEMELSSEFIIKPSKKKESYEEIKQTFKKYYNGNISSIFYTDEDYDLFLKYLQRFFYPDETILFEEKQIVIKHGAGKDIHPLLKNIWNEYKEGYLKCDTKYLEHLKFIKKFQSKSTSQIYNAISREKG